MSGRESRASATPRPTLDGQPIERLYVPQGARAWPRSVLRAMGWRIEFEGLPMQNIAPSGQSEQWVSRGVIVAYPHTSNWDGLIGVLTLWALNIRLTLWGKASLFRVPVVAQILRSVGAVPIDRTDARGAVAATVTALNSREVSWLGLAPEGTRKRLPGWRTGFYHVARAAGVPVGLAYLDWQHKRIGITDFITLSGDLVADFERIARLYAGVQGCVPQNASPIQALDRGFDRKQAVVRS